MVKRLKKKIVKSKIKDTDIITIGGVDIARGERVRVQLEIAALYDFTQLTIPVEIIRGKEKGPVLFISAAVHGDEINGVEIVRKLLKKSVLKKIKGTLILVPIVNVFGFNYKSRYLPDRRDLNRSFPGSTDGSLASRIAHTFMKEIVSKCTHGIDLHTAAVHRTNLPQIRACLDDEQTRILAEGFGAPVVVNSKLRDGSLREAARKKKVAMLLFEGGEALRFEESVINKGLNGCLSVMAKIGMIEEKTKTKKEPKTFIAKSSYWTRASRSGIISIKKKVGAAIKVGDLLGVIADPFARNSTMVYAENDGILIGAALLPLVNQGDALFHIATFQNAAKVKKALDIHSDLFD
jgi:predicted deacylase